MNKWNLSGIVVVVVLLGVGAYFLLPPAAKAPVDTGNNGNPDTNVDMGNGAEKTDLIVVDAPKPNTAISSPLSLSGKARGYWYFEASFPYELQDASGKVIAQGPVQAGGDWMTEDFVPFLLSIPFASQPAGSKGKLILRKDNPSGLPENDDSVIIPVTFK